VLLYFACRWYRRFKMNRNAELLRYL